MNPFLAPQYQIGRRFPERGNRQGSTGFETGHTDPELYRLVQKVQKSKLLLAYNGLNNFCKRHLGAYGKHIF